MINTILAKRVSHIVAKGGNPVWPKGSKSRGFSRSIPIISDLERILGVKTVLMGFGLESDAIHSPNENFRLDIFRKGIEAVAEFHREFGK